MRRTTANTVIVEVAPFPCAITVGSAGWVVRARSDGAKRAKRPSAPAGRISRAVRERDGPTSCRAQRLLATTRRPSPHSSATAGRRFYTMSLATSVPHAPEERRRPAPPLAAASGARWYSLRAGWPVAWTSSTATTRTSPRRTASSSSTHRPEFLWADPKQPLRDRCESYRTRTAAHLPGHSQTTAQYSWAALRSTRHLQGTLPPDDVTPLLKESIA